MKFIRLLIHKNISRYFNIFMVQDSYNKKHKHDLIDFYEVLGIDDRDTTTSEIRKKYVKLAAKYHPDKYVDNDPQIFSLIQRAWECLGNEEKRKEYDFFLSMEEKSKNSDFLNLKKGFTNYMDLKKNEPVDEHQLKRAKLEFDAAFDDMDKKNNFDRKKYSDVALAPKEAINRLTDLALEREQQEIEFTQARIFSGDKLDDDKLKKFNEYFDMYKNEREKNNKLIKRSDAPSAWNSVISDNQFTLLDSFDKDYDDTYEPSSNYGSFTDLDNEVKIDLDFDKFKGSADYVLGHNHKNNDYNKEIENKLREREIETKKYSNPTFNDFKDDKSFMFSHEVGYVGNITWDDDNDNEELQSACYKLLELEKM